MPGRRRKTPFMNRLSMQDRTIIIGLLRLRWSEREIGRQTGYHRATIRNIALEAAAELAQPATVPEVATDFQAVPAAEVLAGPPQSRSVCEPFRPFIEAEVRKGRGPEPIC